jgi:pentapeptide MXKDX repeat protein
LQPQVSGAVRGFIFWPALGSLSFRTVNKESEQVGRQPGFHDSGRQRPCFFLLLFAAVNLQRFQPLNDRLTYSGHRSQSTSRGIAMRKIVAAVVAAMFGLTSVAALAADEMKKDEGKTEKKAAPKKESKKEGSKEEKKEGKKGAMTKDEMKKDEMKDHDMKK